MRQPQLQVKKTNDTTLIFFKISLLTADICMHSTTLNMLTKPWNYLKKQIPAVGTHTWTAYIKVPILGKGPSLVCSIENKSCHSLTLFKLLPQLQMPLLEDSVAGGMLTKCFLNTIGFTMNII